MNRTLQWVAVGVVGGIVLAGLSYFIRHERQVQVGSILTCDSEPADSKIGYTARYDDGFPWPYRTEPISESCGFTRSAPLNAGKDIFDQYAADDAAWRAAEGAGKWTPLNFVADVLIWSMPVTLAYASVGMVRRRP
jgi:hypothetical protein